METAAPRPVMIVVTASLFARSADQQIARAKKELQILLTKWTLTYRVHSDA